MLVAGIHQGELGDAPAREVLDFIQRTRDTWLITEIVSQPPFDTKPSVADLRAWRRNQRHLEDGWRRYLGTQSPVRAAQSAVGHLLFGLRLRFDSNYRQKCWRSRQVESFVTAKHVQAWREALDSGVDGLIVLESDAGFRDELERGLELLAAWIADCSDPLYINLAGGLAYDRISVSHLIRERNQTDITFAKPVTNTSCAYVVNRAFLDAAIHFVDDASDGASQLGIDWLFNSLFLQWDAESRVVFCRHMDPPILAHGSVTGLTKSWHPDR